MLRGEEKEAAASVELLRNRVGSNDPLIQVRSFFWDSEITSFTAGTRRDATGGYPCQRFKRARRKSLTKSLEPQVTAPHENRCNGDVFPM